MLGCVGTQRKGRRVAIVTDEGGFDFDRSLLSLASLEVKPRRKNALKFTPNHLLLMASHPAIRLAAKSTKSAVGCIYLQCHVKPGASKQREGVVSVSDTVIEVCVSAQPKDGEANLSVRKVFSDVYCYSACEAWRSFD